MEVLEIIDKARRQVVGDAVDEDLVSGRLLAEFMMTYPGARLKSYPKSTILT
jgi:hypothetical protein